MKNNNTQLSAIHSFYNKTKNINVNEINEEENKNRFS